MQVIDTDEALTDRVTQLERHNRQLRLMALGMLLLVLPISAAVLTGAARTMNAQREAAPRVEKFDEITVGRINIAGPDGVNRIILSHEVPQVPLQGVELERTVPPGMAGMIFCAANGDEVGGIGASGTEHFGHALFMLDYRNSPLEAIGFGTRHGPNGQSAGLVVMEPPTDSVDIARLAAGDAEEIAQLQSMMIERVLLGVENFEAGLVIKDRHGNDRIVLNVDAENTPVVMILDEHGAEVARLGAD